MVYKCFVKKFPGCGVKSKIMSNQHVDEWLYKPIFRKFEKGKVHPSFKEDNIWGTDLANVQLLSKNNKEIRVLLGVIVILSVVPLKDWNDITITNAFQINLD